MKKIKIFLASSNELKYEREQIEIRICQKSKLWFDKGVFLHIDIWEDFSARMSLTGSQSEYNKFVKDADLIVFLAYSKVGMYTEEEFEHAFGQFQSTKKPFIFTYFKTPPENTEDSLAHFKQKLNELKHFYANFNDINDLWNQFNKELERLYNEGFTENRRPEKNRSETDITQTAEKIYNIEKIDSAEFEVSEGITERTKIISDQVEFSVYSPKTIRSGSNFILDVWASFLHQSSEVLLEAKSLGRENRLGVKKGISVSLGANLEVSVNIDSLDIEDPYDTLEWNGTPINASFSVHVPEETKIGNYNGKAIISYDGIVIAKVIFLVFIGEKEKMDYENVNRTTFYPKSAFASYSSEDRIAVLSRIDGMKKIAPNIDVFCDVLTLRSGEDWLERIKEEVSAKDIFYLFWSHHAAESEWVEKEWRLALNQRGIDYIDPVPLEDVDIAPPPQELKKKHFSSNISNLIKILEWKKQWKEDMLNV
jgi:hypothetical protein